LDSNVLLASSTFTYNWTKDEPTANVDKRTDELLQEALRRSFKESTILAVAHRLDTVIDYDLILVIGKGKKLEYGSPARLLSNPQGHFTSMIHECGENIKRELLRKVALN
jgi:ATP-binding cassette subfamily C (CFTR/MRP) protein 4